MVEPCIQERTTEEIRWSQLSTSFLSFLVFEQLLLHVASYFIASFANTTIL